MTDVEKRGISGITGKIVMIRHATDRDRTIVEHYVGQENSDRNIKSDDIAVALENDRIIGFGILKKDRSGGCVSLFEDSRRKGIGASIAKHLARYSGLEKVYTTRSATYFTHLRLATGKNTVVSRRGKGAFLCRMPLMERLPIAAQT